MASGKIPKYADGTDSGWLTATSYNTDNNGYTGTIYYRQIGDVCNIVAYNIHLRSDFSSGSYRTLVSSGLPLPKTVLGAVTRELGFVLLRDTGGLRYYRPSGVSVTTSTDITFSITYLTA